MAARLKPPPCILTIAGSDSGGGAGIQADARTIHALGGYALTAITAVTAQNTRGVQRWTPVAPEMIGAQIAAVLLDFPVKAIKTGLLPNAEAIEIVASTLALHADTPCVVDPVIGSTSGSRFLPEGAVATLIATLLPKATLVTPNWPELAALAQRTVDSFAAAENAARRLADTCGAAVLAKGGHAPGKLCRDCLVTPGEAVRWFESPRVATRNTHGTGCVLSAAIATELGRGSALPQAVAKARLFLTSHLRAGRGLKWGGAGPAFAGLK